MTEEQLQDVIAYARSLVDRVRVTKAKGNRADAEDIIQSALVDFLEHWKAGTEVEAARGYFYRIVSAKAYEFVEKNKRYVELPPHTDFESNGDRQVFSEENVRCNRPNPKEQLLAKEYRELIISARQQLSESDRKIVEQFMVLDFDRERIAESLNLTETQERLRKSRAKARLVEIIREKLKPQKSLRKLPGNDGQIG